MGSYNPLEFGRELRAYRNQRGWSAGELCEEYAGFVGREDAAPDPTYIYHIERGMTLVSQRRRAILACLVGMPLTLVGIAEPDSLVPLDISELCRDKNVLYQTIMF
jgi:transcriptional regulator with XRE-family HTH domain